MFWFSSFLSPPREGGLFLLFYSKKGYPRLALPTESGAGLTVSLNTLREILSLEQETFSVLFSYVWGPATKPIASGEFEAAKKAGAGKAKADEQVDLTKLLIAVQTFVPADTDTAKTSKLARAIFAYALVKEKRREEGKLQYTGTEVLVFRQDRFYHTL